MSVALRKEIRLLRPMWLAAMAASTIPVWMMGWKFSDADVYRMGLAGMEAGFRNKMFNLVYEGLMRSQIQQMSDFSIVLFAMGVLLLALASFGLEMSFGTFPSLLAQPRPRLDIWKMKIGVLASAIFMVAVAASLSWSLRLNMILTEGERAWPGATRYLQGFWPEHINFLLLLTVLAFAGGLWTTLLFRQTMAAFWFAILVPWMLFYFSWPLVERLGDGVDFMAYLALVSCGYAAAGYFLARWLFLQAQDKPEREAMDVSSAWSLLPVFRTRRHPLAALLVKELRLQQGTLVIAIVLALLHLAAVAAPSYLPPAVLSAYSWFQYIWMIWLVAPLLVGCAAVAEERRGRTLEGTLCLPVRGPLQFAIKLLVVFGLGIFLGAVMPWWLEMLRPAAGLDLSIKNIGLPALLFIAAIITALGCYGSSLSGTLLQALGTALMLGVVLIVAFKTTERESNPLLVWPVFIALSIYLSYLNFKHLRMTRQQWLRNGNICLVVIAATTILWFFLGGAFVNP